MYLAQIHHKEREQKMVLPLDIEPSFTASGKFVSHKSNRAVEWVQGTLVENIGTLKTTHHTLKTLAAQRLCISAMGTVEPRGWTRPITASVGFSRSGGNTYLYRLTLVFFSTCEGMQWMQQHDLSFFAFFVVMSVCMSVSLSILSFFLCFPCCSVSLSFHTFLFSLFPLLSCLSVCLSVFFSALYTIPHSPVPTKLCAKKFAPNCVAKSAHKFAKSTFCAHFCAHTYRNYWRIGHIFFYQNQMPKKGCILSVEYKRRHVAKSVIICGAIIQLEKLTKFENVQ